jgi:hypothetical protein
VCDAESRHAGVGSDLRRSRLKALISHLERYDHSSDRYQRINRYSSTDHRTITSTRTSAIFETLPKQVFVSTPKFVPWNYSGISRSRKDWTATSSPHDCQFKMNLDMDRDVGPDNAESSEARAKGQQNLFDVDM